MPGTISFRLNGEPVRLNVDGERRLLWVLRSELAFTGTKFGCDEGHCGACTVLVDRRAVRSCLLKVKEVQDKDVATIEGLARNGQLHPVQKAFMQHDALQCGFCTPGMILTAVSLLHFNPQPSREQIIQGMEQNLCRCGTYRRVVQAIETAARSMKGG